MAPEGPHVPAGAKAFAAAAGLDAADTPTPAARAPVHGAITLFTVAFATEMTERHLAVLARELDLSTNLRLKGRPPRDDLGFARLDHHSGLFLKRSPVEGQWLLQARTWGDPAPDAVHRWHVLAAGAAHQLDATVTPPERMRRSAPAVLDRRLEPAGNTRLGRFRRALVGLS
jgi:hypothetical protein